jgi:hypothetical protein
MKKPADFFRGLASVLLVVNLLLNSGCLHFGAPAAPAGTVTYVDGELDASLGNRYEAVAAAASQAIPQLGLGRPDETRDEYSDTFLTHTAKGAHVQIVVTKANDNLTTVSILLDAPGDQPLSRAILEKIKANL